MLLASVVVLAMGGCRKPLLATGEERSQFDRYDRVREQDPSPYYMDEFGRRRPNLRGRLLPRE
ncbi:MAG: hypothetical protein DYG94_14065 [Leptolyngbya sp. PLA3]|nr:MAG: hypothetical protein EDM82_14620 [Cyanobacteria bacterium CYA]MCE7969853.1 hypothetical protein [Leptolyngbya sp. PL-A3]